MKTIVSAVILGLAATARAQIPVDSQQLAKLKSQMAQLKALAPAAVDARDVDTLVDRLASDGTRGQTDDGQEARSYVHPGVPDTAGDVQNTRMTLIENELPPPVAGVDKNGNSYTYTVERKQVVQLLGEIRRYTVLPQGEARLEEWTFAVDPATDRLVEAVKTTLVGRRRGADGLVVDQKRSQEVRLKPSDPSVQSQWKALSEEFLRSGNTFSA